MADTEISEPVPEPFRPDGKHAQLIASYREAFEAANGRPCDPLSYEQGWFVFRDDAGRVDGRYRAIDLELMRNVLVARASPAQAPENGTPHPRKAPGQEER